MENSVTISPGCRTVLPGPLKKVSMGTDLSAAAEAILTWASRTSIGGAVSAEGAVLQRLPPMVAEFLT